MSRGRLIKIEIGDGEAIENFVTLNGIRDVDFAINRQLQNIDSPYYQSQWQALAAATGVMSVKLTIQGVFNGLPPDERLASCALNGDAFNVRIYFSGGDSIAATFLVASYRRSTSADGSEIFNAVLESSGQVT